MPPIPDREYIFENMRQRRMLSMISRGQFFNTPAMKGGIRLNSSGSQAAPEPTILDLDIVGVNTTEDGRQVFLAIGDSNMAGSSAQDSITVTSGIMYKWNGSSFEITTTGVSATAGKASMFEEFIIAYNARTGYTGGFVNRGQSSTAFGPTNTMDFNLAWAGQPRYTQAVNECNEALVSWGLTRPRIIFMNLGVNDQSNSSSVATYWNEVLDDLTDDFPGVPIVAVIPGTKSSSAQGAYNQKTRWLEQIIARDNVWFAACAPAITTIGDNLHYDRTGLGDIGKMFNRLLSNSAYSNKWVRGIIASHFDDLSEDRKQVLKYVFERQVANGNYFKLETLHIFQTSDDRNIKNCYAFLGGMGTPVGVTVNANLDIEVSAATDIPGRFKTTTYNGRGSQTDMIAGIRISAITTPAANNASLFGAIDSNANFSLKKGNGVMLYAVNDLTERTVAATAIQENSLYCIARDGNTRRLLKDGGTVLHEEELASTGTPSTLNGTHIGAHTAASGSPTNKITAKLKYFFAAKYNGFDLASFYNDMEYLMANW